MSKKGRPVQSKELIQVLELSKYTNPIIDERKNSKDLFVSYGNDNNYFQYLIDQYIGSTTNNSVINGICSLIYGKGFGFEDEEINEKNISFFKKLVSKKCTKKIGLMHSGNTWPLMTIIG